MLDPGSRPLPFGRLEISVDEKTLRWSSYRMTRFISLGEFKVRGFLNRYRQAGIGAPLAAELTAAGEGPEAEEARKRIPPRLKVPVTALLNIEDVSTGIATGNLKGRIEVYAPLMAAVLAYLWTAIVGRTDPLFIAMAAGGKLAFFGLLVAYWLAGELPARAPLSAIGDLVFGTLFAAWLAGVRRA